MRTACCRPGASMATTATRTSARRRPGSATSSGPARIVRRPTTRTRELILLLSSHLETGHYFNPHAQRIIESQSKGAHAHHNRPAAVEIVRESGPLAAHLSRHRGALLLAIAEYLLDEDLVRSRVRGGLGQLAASTSPRSGRICRARSQLHRRAEGALRRVHAGVCRGRNRRAAETIVEAAKAIAAAGSAFATHSWRSAAAGNSGAGRSRAVCYLLVVLTGSVGRSAASNLHVTGTSSCRSIRIRRRRRNTGTSCSSRASSRSPSTN